MNYKSLARLSVIFLVFAVTASFAASALSVSLDLSDGIRNAADRIAILSVLMFGFVNIVIQDPSDRREEHPACDNGLTAPIERME